MRNYSGSNTGEKESYVQYKNRRTADWAQRLKDICIEIGDSSLKEEDKEKVITTLLLKRSMKLVMARIEDTDKK